MKTVEMIGQYVMPETKLTDEALAKARFDFGGTFGRKATELRASTEALNGLLAEYGKDKRPVDLHDQTVQGIAIIEDGDLDQGAWYVGWSDEIVREVK